MVSIPCFVLLLIHGYLKSATAVFIFAAITDLLDGLLARKLQQKTALGSFLDPMADKLLITSAFVTLTVPSVPVAFHIPIWLTITSISRDLLIALAVLIIYLHTRHTQFPPSFLGKCTTTAQLITVGTALVGHFHTGFGMEIFPPVVYSTLALTVVSGLHYLYRSVHIIERYQRPDAANGGARHQGQ
jgi:cardiolipin synthase (CMP-forming)